MAEITAGQAPRAGAAMPPLTIGAFSWSLFEGARNPYVILCLIYLFSPYIANEVVGDPVRGQETIAGWHKIAGVLVALTAPFLGAAADRMGHRKPLLALAVLAMTPTIFIQYWATPAGMGGLPLWGVGTAIILVGVFFAYSEVLHNSMLAGAAPPRLQPHVSGLGLALGNAAAVLMLAGVAWALALPGRVEAGALVPAAPLFGLDPAQHEPSRAIPALCAIWLFVFSIPLFLFTRDAQATGVPFARALRDGAHSLFETVRRLRAQSMSTLIFLIARMLYADGKGGILIFSGVYVAGAMDWGLLEMCAFGVILSIFAVGGGFLAGVLDDVLGPRNAVLLEIGVTFACLIAMVSMTPDRIFFFIPVDEGAPIWNAPIFRTAPEVAYIGVTMIIAISITAAYSSSRTLLLHLAPKGMEGELFGLYALAGSATAWLAPLLVETFTHETQSLRIGFASISILLLVGFVLMFFVRPPPRPEHH
jgi:UMF1 family MFS transporter